MSYMRWIISLSIAVLATSSLAIAQQEQPRKTSFMRVHGQALPPFGFVHFCRRHRSDCEQGDSVAFTRFNATAARLRELDIVNREINARIQPVTDLELYGREEYWTYPTNRGDCEDYVVLKRRILISRGWPPSALLITVVRDELGDGHAVLTARTEQGDFVLDNKNDLVKLWGQTPYQYLMRQSYLNPTLWMALDPGVQYRSGTIATTTTD
ncbi:MAG: transglutaminase-like cysteine peptidase [Hyphomicrobiaceae bacterium]